MGIVADNTNPKSIASRLRARRFNRFCQLLEATGSQVRIVDVGGSAGFWRSIDWMKFANQTAGGGVKRFEITVVNISTPAEVSGDWQEVCSERNIEVVLRERHGDACSLVDYSDDEFDVAFSNSVIEHVGDRARQKAMADEIVRVAERVYLQTPCRWFPIEPHFLFPFFQFLPRSVRIGMLRRRRLGWMHQQPDPVVAGEVVDSIRLLGRSQLRDMFPGAQIKREMLGPFVKSYLVFIR